MIPISITLPISEEFKKIIEIPITLQIPTVILLSIIFRGKIVYKALNIYLFLGLFIIPIFHQGGSTGYLLSSNFGYLIGLYPLIRIIDNLNRTNNLSMIEFIKNGFKAICYLHIIGIIYSFFLMIYYREFDIFLYNLGYFSLGKIGFHLLILLPISLIIKPIKILKNSK